VARLVDASELVQHAAGSRQPWLAINGRIYDMTEFRELRRGGDVLSRRARSGGRDARRPLPGVGARPVPHDRARNALRADLSIRDRQTTRDRAPAETTPHRVQFCIEAHDRFLLNVEELLGAPLERLTAPPTCERLY
jgi:cytochrome b involved in lipid metabolism